MKIINKKIIFEGIIFLAAFFMSYNVSFAAGCCIKNSTLNKSDASNCAKNVADATACASMSTSNTAFIKNDVNCTGVVAVSSCGGSTNQNQIGCCIIDTKDPTKYGPANCQSNVKRTDCSGANSLFDVDAGSCFASSACASSGGPQIQNSNISGTTDPGGIIQCGRHGQQMCTLCDLIKGINTVIQYIMKIAIGVALLALAIGGIMYAVSAGESSAMELAKSTIRNAAIGFVIVFAAYLIVNTTITYLGVTQTLGMKTATTWGQFDCTATGK